MARVLSGAWVGAAATDTWEVTFISIIDRRSSMAQPQCERCGHVAWAQTPNGLRCEDHTLTEVHSAIRQGKADWVPRILRARRQGAHTA